MRSTWRRSFEGLIFIGKMATNSYHMAVRETKDHLKGILTGPNSSLNWNNGEVEFDLRIAEEHNKEMEKKASDKKEADQTSASKAPSVSPQLTRVNVEPPTPRPPSLLLLPRALTFLLLKGPKVHVSGKSSEDGDGTGSTDSSPDNAPAP